MPDQKGTKRNIQSVERAYAILKCFEHKKELGLTEISRRVGLHKSTAAGLVTTLLNLKMLAQNEDNEKYRLGIETFHLGMCVQFDMREICRPYLQSLVADTQETVNLVTFDEDGIIYVEKMESPHSMRICTSIGQRLPFVCTGTGKAILAFLDDAKIQSVLDKEPLIARTENSITSRDEMMRHLSEIRQAGYACDLEELEYGLMCVGVPLLDGNGKVVGGISVSGPDMRMTEDIRRQIGKKLLAAAADIRKKLYA